jgi:hypothetical protein
MGRTERRFDAASPKLDLRLPDLICGCPTDSGCTH